MDQAQLQAQIEMLEAQMVLADKQCALVKARLNAQLRKAQSDLAALPAQGS